MDISEIKRLVEIAEDMVDINDIKLVLSNIIEVIEKLPEYDKIRKISI